MSEWAPDTPRSRLRVATFAGGTVVVSPGDFIFGTTDGVVVIPKAATIAVLIECERWAGDEDAARAGLGRGEDLVRVIQRHRR